MPTEKTVNYSDEIVAKMVSTYQAAGNDVGPDGDKKRQAAMLEIQSFTGKSLPSIRSKLGQLGIYIAKTQPKKKSDRVKKSDLIDQIAKGEGKSDSFFDSLENANKSVLEYILSLQVTIEGLNEVINSASEEVLEADSGDVG